MGRDLEPRDVMDEVDMSAGFLAMYEMNSSGMCNSKIGEICRSYECLWIYFTPGTRNIVRNV